MSSHSAFDRKLPEQYEHLISQQQYDEILDICIAILTQQGTVQSIQDGTICMGSWGEHKEIHISLDNLVRKCKGSDRQDWEGIVSYHFSKFPTNESAINYIYKDYEFASTLLKILIKPKGTFQKIENELVNRIDFPGTRSFLVIDFDDKFHFVNSQHINEWEQDIEDLFIDALINIEKEKIESACMELPDGKEVFAFFNGDYAASYLIDLEKNAPETIGEMGAIVAIPTKGAAFAFPINDDDIMRFIISFNPVVEKIYNEDEYPIIEDYYWYYEGSYERFTTHPTEDGRYMMMIPEHLLMLMAAYDREHNATDDDDIEDDEEE